jgi:hypothetical protein
MSTIPNRVSGKFSFTDLMIFRRTWWQHLIFWGVVIFILLNIFKTSSSFERIDLVYTLLFLVPLISVVYLNLYLAIPLFLRKEKYLLFGLSTLLLAGGGALWLYMLFDRWTDFILPHYYFISYYTVLQLMIFTGSMLALTTLIKLSRSWFMMLRVERINAGHQLKALQSQINPHFLLNSLQTIYALSLEHAEETPRAILQLSDILKYTLYETDQARVKLEKEIQMITDYVEMYRFRVDPQKVLITLEMEGETGNLFIAPMLLVPFVENAFKHGLRGGPEPATISIALTVQPGHLRFMVKNSPGNAGPGDLDQKKGIGIENTRQRLALLYPGRHSLSISRTPDLFSVTLQLVME